MDENNFEKDYYMAVNVFRAYPSKFISIVRELIYFKFKLFRIFVDVIRDFS